jgi:membrane fusion protein (multidrug efflux system)
VNIILEKNKEEPIFINKLRKDRMNLKIEKNKSTVWISIALLQFLVILGLGYYFLKNQFKSIDVAAQTARKLPAVQVETVFVHKGTYQKYISAVGSLKASETVKLASQEGGIVEKVLFKSGQKVAQGDPLLQFEKAEAEARLNETLSKFRTTKSIYERSKALYERKIETLSKLEEAENAYRVAAANVEINRLRLEKTTVRAPFDGFLGLKEISPGGYLKPGQDFVTLDKTDPMYLDFMLNEKHVSTITVGQEIMVEIDGFPQNDYTAIIESIEPSADATGHTIRVRAELPNANQELRSGFFARIKIPEFQDDSAIIIPESALENSGNQDYVFIVVDGVARQVPIEVASRNGQVAKISRGLRPGQVIIVSGQKRVANGVKVLVRSRGTIQKYKQT